MQKYRTNRWVSRCNYANNESTVLIEPYHKVLLDCWNVLIAFCLRHRTKGWSIVCSIQFYFRADRALSSSSKSQKQVSRSMTPIILGAAAHQYVGDRASDALTCYSKVDSHCKDFCFSQ